MFSVKKWFASKISNSSNEDSINRNYVSAGRSISYNTITDLDQSCSNQFNSSFDISNGEKTILQFYYSDDELNLIAAELESFDGRRDPLRCTELVSQLRIAQDKVMQLIFQLMDEWKCNRASRDYRLKFPDDLLNDSENGETFNGQIWFSAECLASGSDIMNHEAESDMLRPLAKELTKNLDQLRLLLRQSTLDIQNKHKFYKDLIRKMELFDKMFSVFEFEYVKAMLPIKSIDEIEKQQELIILFSEALDLAIKRNLIKQSDIDEFNPSIMITLPRLAIVHGLVNCGNDNPIFRKHKHNLSNVFKSYHNVLHQIYGMLINLKPIEIFMLEKLLSNEENLNDCLDSSFDETNYSIHFNEFCLKKDRFKKKSISYPCYSEKPLKRVFSLPVLNKSKYLIKNFNLDNFKKIIDYDEVDFSLKKLKNKLKKCLSLSLISKKIYHTNTDLENNLQNQYVENNFSNDYIYETSSQNSNTSIARSSFSLDFYEINYALENRNSIYISDLFRQLLHKLFVSISGIADQLQSNFASDLRQILKTVFQMHLSPYDQMDSSSVEEAEEALENISVSKTTNFEEILNNSEHMQILFSTTLNAIDNASSSRLDLNEAQNNSDIATNSRISNYSSNFLQESCSNTDGTSEFPPLWVPDDQVNECKNCKVQFTLLRRRHHCRNCGYIFCNSCSNNFMCLYHYGYNKPVRVCKLCHITFVDDSN